MCPVTNPNSVWLTSRLESVWKHIVRTHHKMHNKLLTIAKTLRQNQHSGYCTGLLRPYPPPPLTDLHRKPQSVETLAHRILSLKIDQVVVNLVCCVRSVIMSETEWQSPTHLRDACNQARFAVATQAFLEQQSQSAGGQRVRMICVCVCVCVCARAPARGVSLVCAWCSCVCVCVCGRGVVQGLAAVDHDLKLPCDRIYHTTHMPFCHAHQGLSARKQKPCTA